jgi:hypothetical protein
MTVFKFKNLKTFQTLFIREIVSQEILKNVKKKFDDIRNLQGKESFVEFIYIRLIPKFAVNSEKKSIFILLFLFL